MSFSETIFLFVLALLVFGPKKLPEIARTIGKALNEFRRASNEFKAQIEQEIAHLEVNKSTILPPAQTPEGTASRTLHAAPPPVESAVSSAPPSEATVALAGPESSATPPSEVAVSEVAASVISEEPHA